MARSSVRVLSVAVSIVTLTLAQSCAHTRPPQASSPASPALASQADAALDVLLVPTAELPTEDELGKALASLAQSGVVGQREIIPLAGLPGLEGEFLPYVTAKLTEAEREQFTRAEHAVLVHFDFAWSSSSLRASYEAVQALAEKHRMFVFDLSAMDAFTAEGWSSRRLVAGWPEDRIFAPAHFNVHLVPTEDGLVMLDTGGLERFGLSDLVMTGVSQSDVRAAGHLLNAVVQRLVEGARPDASGRMRVRVAEIQQPAMRELLTESSFTNATGQVVVQLVAPEGNADVREGVQEIVFPQLSCTSRGECLDLAMGQFLGWEDEVVNADHDEKYLAAVKRALGQLEALEPAFQKGLSQGEYLLVKARFPHERGNEWMWIEVHSWNGDSLSGRLESTPQYVQTVKSGSSVTVSFADVADYMHMFGDGTFAGNETGKVIQPELFEDAGNGRTRLRR